MSIEVETVVAVSVMMAVFSAVAAVGSSIVLGAGFERLRAGFEVISKQAGFFSDAIYKLEEKMDVVDAKAGEFSRSIAIMEGKVSSVGDQANSFTDSMVMLKKKVNVVDKQTGFFSDAINRLESKVDNVIASEETLSENRPVNVDKYTDVNVISIDKTEALVSHAEQLLTQIGVIADKISENNNSFDLQDTMTANSFTSYTHMPAVDALEDGVSYN